MKKIFKIVGILVGLAVLAAIVVIALMPWMDSWGATSDEINATYAGDELVPSPRYVYRRVVTLNAAPRRSIPGWCKWAPNEAACTRTVGLKRTSYAAN